MSISFLKFGKVLSIISSYQPFAILSLSSPSAIIYGLVLLTHSSDGKESASLLKRDFGAKTQNGVYSAANYTNGSFGSNFVSAGIQTSFRTGNPTGTYQNGYDSTQQYGSNVPNMHNGMNQQAYAYPATAAVSTICYPMPTENSQ